MIPLPFFNSVRFHLRTYPIQPLLIQIQRHRLGARRRRRDAKCPRVREAIQNARIFVATFRKPRSLESLIQEYAGGERFSEVDEVADAILHDGNGGRCRLSFEQCRLDSFGRAHDGSIRLGRQIVNAGGVTIVQGRERSPIHGRGSLLLLHEQPFVVSIHDPPGETVRGAVNLAIGIGPPVGCQSHLPAQKTALEKRGGIPTIGIICHIVRQCQCRIILALVILLIAVHHAPHNDHRLVVQIGETRHRHGRAMDQPPRRPAVQRIGQCVPPYPVAQSILHQRHGVRARRQSAVRVGHPHGEDGIAIASPFETGEDVDAGGGVVGHFCPSSSSSSRSCSGLEQFGTTDQLLAVADDGDVPAPIDVDGVDAIARHEKDEAGIVDFGGSREGDPVFAALDGRALRGFEGFEPSDEGGSRGRGDVGFGSWPCGCCCCCCCCWIGIVRFLLLLLLLRTVQQAFLLLLIVAIIVFRTRNGTLHGLRQIVVQIQSPLFDQLIALFRSEHGEDVGLVVFHVGEIVGFDVVGLDAFVSLIVCCCCRFVVRTVLGTGAILRHSRCRSSTLSTVLVPVFVLVLLLLAQYTPSYRFVHDVREGIGGDTGIATTIPLVRILLLFVVGDAIHANATDDAGNLLRPVPPDGIGRLRRGVEAERAQELHLLLLPLLLEQLLLLPRIHGTNVFLVVVILASVIINLLCVYESLLFGLLFLFQQLQRAALTRINVLLLGSFRALSGPLRLLLAVDASSVGVDLPSLGGGDEFVGIVFHGFHHVGDGFVFFGRG
mmetsp:Transcript_3052/g.6705  ORF Transcript_3052/g.6705 Transcript_3052/m.6705 type:complete len:775 (+) Transcript_3052:458-2782(+)